ncbi:glycoside hydrolase family 97 protein [Sinomicrobium soli]|uniref:glycoside hydrolase family 97 protein n=1 Tax=Sinomicrobium sp. N-1-3-6 TaxID=2219864 RepID=UPI000DCDA653|nr:glycoside hydrolase family 97 protein [Sinomicrobium sp. N-1-3-6]RAV30181.1 glycoside hydrolase family 97 protein [Sinomicrobium sp. N-1-3-6]
MNLYKTLFLKTTLLFLCAGGYATARDQLSIESPDGMTRVSLNWPAGELIYRISHKEKTFLEDSPLGLKTSLGDFSQQLTYVSSATAKIEESYELDRAKVSHVDYVASELNAVFVNGNRDTLNVIFRVSDRDVAFSYRIASREGKSNIRIFEELSGFNLPDEATTYITPQALPMTGWMETKPSYEEEYTLNEAMGKPSAYGVGYTFPALFKWKDNGWLLISETGTDSRYPGCRLGEGTDTGLYHVTFPQEGENNGIGINYAAQALPARTPWRTVTLGESLKPIVESTVAFDLVEEAYKPAVGYRPGRAAWSWIVWQDDSINYEDQLKYIDLAAALDFEYVLIDNHWDLRIGRDRIRALVDYAGDRGVEVILWYNSNGYWNEAPQTPKHRMNNIVARQQEMAWLRDTGVKGIKVDFLGGDKQETIKLYEEILTDANNYGLAVNFHGCTLPRGWERMYPNYVSSEAVLASENLVFRQDAMDKHAMNATVLPFTRNTAGAMDFGPLFLNKKLSRDQKGGTVRSTTDAFELATAVLYFSPVQHFGLTPDNLDQPGHVLDFIRAVPTVWDETLYIGGTPEDYCALARKKGERWYIAVVNGEKKKKQVELELPMLAGKRVKLLYDRKDTSAGIKEVKIGKDGIFKVSMLPEGGAVLYGSR